jgi:hypothetical protein
VTADTEPRPREPRACLLPDHGVPVRVDRRVPIGASGRRDVAVLNRRHRPAGRECARPVVPRNSMMSTRPSTFRIACRLGGTAIAPPVSSRTAATPPCDRSGGAASCRQRGQHCRHEIGRRRQLEGRAQRRQPLLEAARHPGLSSSLCSRARARDSRERLHRPAPQPQSDRGFRLRELAEARPSRPV